jgi:hypothetical protein
MPAWDLQAAGGRSKKETSFGLQLRRKAEYRMDFGFLTWHKLGVCVFSARPTFALHASPTPRNDIDSMGRCLTETGGNGALYYVCRPPCHLPMIGPGGTQPIISGSQV